MEKITAALNKELTRINEMNKSPEIKKEEISQLTNRVKRVDLVNTFKIKNVDGVYQPHITFKDDSNTTYKYNLGFQRTKCGLGLDADLKALNNGKVAELNATLNSLLTHSFTAKYIINKPEKLDFSSNVIPATIFSIQRQNRQYLSEKYKLFSVKTLSNDPINSYRLRFIRIAQKKRSSQTPANLVSDPEKYNVLSFTYFNYFEKLLFSKTSIGIVHSPNHIQPFLTSELKFNYNFDDTYSLYFGSGKIFSYQTLPTLERFHYIAPLFAQNVDSEKFGINNGSFIAACDHYFSAGFSARFLADEWLLQCDTQMVIGGLSKPRLTELPGSCTDCFTSVRVARTVFGKKLCTTIYYPLYISFPVKTSHFSLSLIDDGSLFGLRNEKGLLSVFFEF